MLFDNWAGIVRILIVGPIAYTAIVVMSCFRQANADKTECL